MIDIPATLTAAGALVAAFSTLIIAYWSYRAKERASTAASKANDAKTEVVLVRGEIRALGKQIDGRLSQLLETSNALARAEGKIEGKAEGPNHG